MSKLNIDLPKKPNKDFKVSSVFNIKSDVVKGFENKTEWVPEIDSSYVFDEDTTLTVLDFNTIEESWFKAFMEQESQLI